MRLLSAWILSFLLIFSLQSTPPDLTPELTKKKIEEILKAHVTFKEPNKELIKRTLSNFLDELDPIKTYLTKKETDRWSNISEQRLNEILIQFKRENFSVFETMYETMVSAITRRNSLEERLAKQPLLKDVQASDFKDLTWAKDEEDLFNRLHKLRSLQLEMADKLDNESKDMLLKRINKRRTSRESEILEDSSEKQTKHVLATVLKAFSSALDSHTMYFTPNEATQFMIQVQQRLFGIGAQLRDDLNGLTIVRLLDGGPALLSTKMKAGDRIIAVNKEPIIGLDIEDAVEKIRGPKGSPVTLTLLRETESVTEEKLEETFDIEIVRDEIVLKETRFEKHIKPFGDGVIAHIKLFSFYQDPNFSSASDIQKALEEIAEEHKIHGVILDLRNNAGGVLPQAVAVCGLFIEKGIVCSIKDHQGRVQHLRNIEGDPYWKGPLVVLTNKGSASASEIVAQTLQDYGRALIIGDKATYGKGSYQTFTLESVANQAKVNPEGEYKVTRGLYYTVSGISPQLNGAQANIVVPGSLSEFEFGEGHGKHPLTPDSIDPNFEDDFSDIHPFHRGRVMRAYKTNLQQKQDFNEDLLSTLTKNSASRIENNPNYQNFLKELKKTEFDIDTFEKFGMNDLQLEETLNIMKDMVLLQSN